MEDAFQMFRNHYLELKFSQKVIPKCTTSIIFELKQQALALENHKANIFLGSIATFMLEEGIESFLRNFDPLNQFEWKSKFLKIIFILSQKENEFMASKAVDFEEPHQMFLMATELLQKCFKYQWALSLTQTCYMAKLVYISIFAHRPENFLKNVGDGLKTTLLGEISWIKFFYETLKGFYDKYHTKENKIAFREYLILKSLKDEKKMTKKSNQFDIFLNMKPQKDQKMIWFFEHWRISKLAKYGTLESLSGYYERMIQIPMPKSQLYSLVVHILCKLGKMLLLNMNREEKKRNQIVAFLNIVSPTLPREKYPPLYLELFEKLQKIKMPVTSPEHVELMKSYQVEHLKKKYNALERKMAKADEEITLTVEQFQKASKSPKKIPYFSQN